MCVNDISLWHFHSAFPVYFTAQSDSPPHTHIHTLITKTAMRGANCTSGAIRGSVSYSMKLPHAAQIQTSDLPITRQPALPPELQPPYYHQLVSLFGNCSVLCLTLLEGAQKELVMIQE